MTTNAAPLSPLDLTDCDREPIHIPGSIQPQGVLFVLREPGLEILQVSESVGGVVGVDATSLAGRVIESILGGDDANHLRRALATEQLDQTPVQLLTARIGPAGNAYHAVAHRNEGPLILELEPAPRPSAAGAGVFNPYALVRSSVARLQAARDVVELWQVAAQEIRKLTGFDRVMTYRFDAFFNGEVVAEDRASELPPFLGHHFPASDIPAQARHLYLLNRLRLIADVGYRPSRLVPPLHPDTGKPVDLSFAALRSVSPIHLEYLKNMGVGASMSISIVNDEGKLWGLIACHHRTPRYVPVEVRLACDFLAQIFSVQLAALQRHADAEHRIRLKTMLAEMLSHMAMAPSFTQGLSERRKQLLAYENASGAALYLNGVTVCIGECPAEAEVKALADWLFDRGEEVFATDALPTGYAPAASFKERASGLLAVSMSRVNRNVLMWFRPEVVRTVTWSGDPHEPALVSGDRRLHPRRSFELWKQEVRDRSLPWSQAELDAAADLRSAIVAVVLRKAEEVEKISSELQRSNRELEAFSYSVSHDLRAPFRHIAGFADLLVKRAATTMDETSRRYVNTIAESAKYAGTLVDSLLMFSHIGRLEIRRDDVDLGALVRTVLSDMQQEIGDRKVEWQVAPLPSVRGDVAMLRLVFRNLLSNALKYTRQRDVAHVHVGAQVGAAGTPDAGMTVLFVRDDGAGFDMNYVGKLFGVFQRLHRSEEFEGTGIGLANVKRIVERHGGRVWAEGQVGKGATFWFTLPRATL